MELLVSGLSETTTNFKHLTGRYVLGIKPWTHCIHGLVTKVEKPIKPSMSNGRYPLRDDLKFFYLCGVGKQNPRDRDDPSSLRRTNVHLAVTPRKGSVASIGSVSGAVFTIMDAEAIPIELLAEGFAELPEAHRRCKNFQFGYQVFDVPEEACKRIGLPIQKLRPRYEKMLKG